MPKPDAITPEMRESDAHILELALEDGQSPSSAKHRRIRRLARLSRGAAKVQEIRNERGVHHYYDTCDTAHCTCGASELRDALDDMLGSDAEAPK